LTTASLTDSSIDLSLVGLMDTCGALNTGYLLFHLWLKAERPDLVAEFISYDDANPFEPIKLGGAISDLSDFESSAHGNLTAVIGCCTPHIDPLGTPITISFALGSNVTVNTIFGLPMLCDLDPVISLRSISMHSRAFAIDFPITRSAANFGLPACCTFDPASAPRKDAITCGLPASAAAAAAAAATFTLAPPTAGLAAATHHDLLLPLSASPLLHLSLLLLSRLLPRHPLLFLLSKCRPKFGAPNLLIVIFPWIAATMSTTVCSNSNNSVPPFVILLNSSPTFAPTSTRDLQEIEMNFVIGLHVAPKTRQAHWDCFCRRTAQGAREGRRLLSVSNPPGNPIGRQR
jgi:hypothetical protein